MIKWSSNCDCGNCEDCNLAYDLANKGLVAYTIPTETSNWTQSYESEDYEEEVYYDPSSPSPDEHIRVYYSRLNQLAGDLYWRENKELWSYASGEVQYLYITRVRNGK